MSSDLNRLLRIEILVRASHPELLAGLDVWLRLGLMSEGQVLQLCRNYLSCPLPEPVVVSDRQSTSPSQLALAKETEKQPIAALERGESGRIWQAFQDELSVRWLLFLGVFLVVVSSGVLAATQWERFPVVGQYGVLWGYTAIFGGVSWWAARQPQLQLTAQTLQTIALLLVPLNFWAMDTFDLWKHPLEWLAVAIASTSLSVLTVLLARQRQISLLYTSVFLGSSLLHWGWAIAGFPLIGVYLVAIATAIVLRFFPRPKGMAFILFPLAVVLVRALFVARLPVSDLGLALGICGWLLGGLDLSGGDGERRSRGAGEQGSRGAMLAPAMLAPEDKGVGAQCLRPEPRIGEEGGDEPLANLYEPIGAILLFFGWLVSLRMPVPWQAVAVSGLGLSFFYRRLQHYGKRRDLAILFAIGLQALFLVWLLIPEALRANAIAVLQQLSGYPYIPWLLASLGSFVYLLVFIHLSGGFDRTGQPQLARFGEKLGLGLGIPIAAVSLFEPGLRSLNLFLLTLSCFLVTHRRPPARVRLVYATHVLGLLAIASTLHWLFPSLNSQGWALIFLGLAAVEWTVSTLQRSQLRFLTERGEAQPGSRDLPASTRLQQLWYQSSWHLGFVLAAVSYLLFARSLVPLTPEQQPLTANVYRRELSWLLAPLTLTGVARTSGRWRRASAAWWSAIALLMAQLLVLWQPGVRLASLGFATLLIGVNARDLRRKLAVVLHLGFVLSFIAALSWEQLSIPEGLILASVSVVLLWLLRTALLRYPSVLARLYADAADYWAVALCVGELLLLTTIALGGYTELVAANWKYVLATGILAAALLGRYSREPNDPAILGASWSVELILAQAAILLGGTTLELAISSLERFAIANILAALIFFGITEGLLWRRTVFAEFASVQVLPVFYALMGIALRAEHFTAYTGFISLGAALVGLGVGRRRQEWKFISYLAIALLSLAWYELVIYQMLQAPEGSPADGFTLLTGVACLIAIAYRLLAGFWQWGNRQRFLNLSIAELEVTAHLHWAIGSMLMPIAIFLSWGTAPRLTSIGILLFLVLAAYAAIQGRETRRKRDRSIDAASSQWISMSCLEYLATWYYARSVWMQLGIMDNWLGILFALVAIALYQIPWSRLGWPERPWQNASLVLPAIPILLSIGNVSSANLLGVAAFYAWVARRRNNLRWSYATLALGNWAIARELERYSLTDPLWSAILIGLSILYIARVDPHFISPQQRANRHHLNLAGIGIICVVALLFHSEDRLGLIPIAIALSAIAIGLGLRVRAFLYAGTTTFLLATSYQLIVLIGRNALSKWIVGLIAGIVLISIAANFERRREQIIAVVKNWVAQLEEWD